MELTFEVLEQAFAPVEKLGNEEIEVPVAGTTITLRALLPEEESLIQKEAASTEFGYSDLSDINDAIDFIEKFKVAVLSHAIIAIGPQSLRGVDFIETSEVLDNGKRVKIPVHMAVRKLVQKWAGPVRTQLFKHYSDFLLKMELKAEQAVHYEPMNLDLELEAAKAKVTRLESEIEKRKSNERIRGAVRTQIHSIAEHDHTAPSSLETDSEPEPKESEVIDIDNTPPSKIETESFNEEPSPVKMAPPPPPPRQKFQTNPTPKPETRPEYDSFIDPDDANAIAVENARLLEARQRAGQPLPPMPDDPVVNEARRQFGHRKAPHVGAYETQKALGEGVLTDENGIPDEFAAMGRNEPEVLSEMPSERQVDKMSIDAPMKDSRNPRFVSRKMP